MITYEAFAAEAFRRAKDSGMSDADASRAVREAWDVHVRTHAPPSTAEKPWILRSSPVPRPTPAEAPKRATARKNGGRR